MRRAGPADGLGVAAAQGEQRARWHPWFHGRRSTSPSDFPGVGKTTLARELERTGGARRLTPDEWLVPLLGLRWAEFAGKRDVLEGRLIWVAHQVLRAGVSVILDFGCWSPAERHATAGPDLARPDLAAEAIRLGRLLHRQLPADPEVTGLLALMLLTDARRPARRRPYLRAGRGRAAIRSS